MKQLPKYQEEYDEEGLTDSLLAAGLIYQSTYDGGHADNEDCNYKFLISSNGSLLLKYGLELANVEEKPRQTEISAGTFWHNL